ncbi:uncharacterized protein LOC143292618 [Babylonia areolata]|uniref:uncharacterized protein LOC143292618 n=1 Tax=Babylonia areolata TaxID=304850 RepID=UPI003FD5A066
MELDMLLQSEGGWTLDQPDYFLLGDIDMIEAPDGLPGISTKSETLADTLEGLSSPVEGSLGTDWMEQDFTFPVDFPLLPLHLDDEIVKLPSTDTLTTTTTAGSSPVEECTDELGSLNHVFADEFLHSLNKEPLLKLDTPPSSPPSPHDQVTPQIVLDADAENSPALQVLESGNIQFLQSPLSPDDVESVLSSASSQSSSPAPTPSPSPSSTVDTSILLTDGSWSFSSTDLYKVVENTDKSRPTPYSRSQKTPKSSKSKGRKQTASISPNPTELELELMSKKDRKKLQNKNAAIRYRMKKKKETDEKRSEVDELEAINDDLREKCDELQREVKCMKDLINDIRKARGQPPLALSQHSLLGHSK